MTMNKDEFWNACLNHIKSNISDQAYSTWFDGLTLTSLSNEELTIQVPNKFHFEWLESKYRHLIDEAIQKAGSHPLVVNYSIVISNKSSDEIPSLVEKTQVSSQPFNKQSKLHNRYIFDNFIEGNGNQFAKAAAIERIGYSSIISFAISEFNSQPLNSLYPTSRSATSSPPKSLWFFKFIFAPIFFNAIKIPSLLGFMLMFFI